MLNKIDIEWADNQHWCTLFKVINAMKQFNAPTKKEKISVGEMQKFIK